jgi:hypothetical protein
MPDQQKRQRPKLDSRLKAGFGKLPGHFSPS